MAEAARLPFVPNHPDVEAAYANPPPGLESEMLHGVLAMSPRPAVPHGRFAKKLGTRLYGPFDEGTGGPGGWFFVDEPELLLGLRPDKMQPDLAGWRRERAGSVLHASAVPTAPDRVCEVLSPSTATHDRDVGLPLYAEHGVAYAWLVDPIARVLEAFAPAGGRWQPVGVWRDDAIAPIAPFDALPIALDRLWPE